MCLIQIVIFLFAASLSMMNDGSQGGGVMNGSTLAPLHALLILLLYYSYNPAGCSCPPYTLCSSTEGWRSSGGGGRGDFLPTVRLHLLQNDKRQRACRMVDGVRRVGGEFAISGLEGDRT